MQFGAIRRFVYPGTRDGGDGEANKMTVTEAAGATTAAPDARPVAARTSDAAKDSGRGEALVRAPDGVTI